MEGVGDGGMETVICVGYLPLCSLHPHTSYLKIATKVTSKKTLQTVASTYTDTQSGPVHSSRMMFPTWRNAPLDPVDKVSL